jgi:hypothetical protein
MAPMSGHARNKACYNFATRASLVYGSGQLGFGAGSRAGSVSGSGGGVSGSGSGTSGSHGGITGSRGGGASSGGRSDERPGPVCCMFCSFRIGGFSTYYLTIITCPRLGSVDGVTENWTGATVFSFNLGPSGKPAARRDSRTFIHFV